MSIPSNRKAIACALSLVLGRRKAIESIKISVLSAPNEIFQMLCVSYARRENRFQQGFGKMLQWPKYSSVKGVSKFQAIRVEGFGNRLSHFLCFFFIVKACVLRIYKCKRDTSLRSRSLRSVDFRGNLCDTSSSRRINRKIVDLRSEEYAATFVNSSCSPNESQRGKKVKMFQKRTSAHRYGLGLLLVLPFLPGGEGVVNADFIAER